MATSRIIKNTPLQAAVKILGPGSVTIDLQDLKTAVQDFDRGNCVVNINTIYFSANGFVNITRNSNIILKLSQETDDWMLSQASGLVIDDENGSNITVTFTGSADGTIILGLSKVAGYSPNVALGADGVQPFTSGN
jgi:hypothetical protein